MNCLGLDIGTRRTGVAFCSTDDDILFSLETLLHETEGELVLQIQDIVASKHIDEVVVGLPLLPSGEEGKQVDLTHRVYDKLLDAGISAYLLDERYTSTQSREIDKDAAAACEILSVWLKKKENTR